jgi:tetratricopeptide (TPR) repeat protein
LALSFSHSIFLKTFLINYYLYPFCENLSQKMQEEGQQGQENHVVSFQTLVAEGDQLLQRNCPHEAIRSYTIALTQRPNDKHCLVSRSRCYIKIGSPELSLQDAEAAIKEDPNYFKGVYQKGEALYAQGDFESALVQFHRGFKMKAEMDEFRIGIQKCREAIENSIGNPKKLPIVVPQRLKKILADRQMAKMQTEETKALGKKGGSKMSLDMASPYQYQGPLKSSLENKLLEELYDDKSYLEGLLSDKDFVENPNDEIVGLVKDGLRYLQTRVEFWRQQNPLYARPKEKHIQPRMLRGKPTLGH